MMTACGETDQDMSRVGSLPEEGVSERIRKASELSAGWGLSSGKKVRAEVTLPMNLTQIMQVISGGVAGMGVT